MALLGALGRVLGDERSRSRWRKANRLGRGIRAGRWHPPVVDALEPRRLLSYDVGFVNAFPANAGAYSPGQNITVTFQFVNNGNTASPATRFYALLGTSRFFDEGGGDTGGGEDPGQAGFGGTLFDVSEGLSLKELSAGETLDVTVTLPVGDGVFTGGPYFIGVFVGLGDTQFLQQDANPGNNFGVSQEALITIVDGVPPRGQGGSNPSPAVGRLDPSFGDGGSGVATSVVNVPNLQTLGTVFDPATGGQWGVARVVGPAGSESGATSTLRLLRFGPDGRLVAGFGDGGLVNVPLTDVILPPAKLARAADGSVFVAANTLGGGAVVKFTSEGVLDASFGVGGVVSGLSVEGRGALTLYAAAAHPSGLIVAGSVGGLGSRDFAVARLAGSGLDTSFGTAGVLTADLGADDVAAAAVVHADGSVVVAGSSGSRLAAIRVTATGQRDLRFGVRGVFLGSVRPGSDERVLVGAAGQGGTTYLGGYSATPGGTSSVAFVLRLSRAGRADGAFGRRGLVELALPGSLAVVNSVLPTPDKGVLVAAQFAASAGDAGQGRVGGALVRLDARGRPVQRFGTNGIAVVFEPPVGPATAGDVAEFAEFLAQREGASVAVPGGRVRALATETDGVTTTTVQVAQLVADGADLAPRFTRPVPSVLRAGRRASVPVQLSNLGTLPAAGQTELALTLVPTQAGPGSTQIGGRVGLANLRVKLNAGQSRSQTVRVLVPAGASGLYTLLARVNPSSAVNDVSSTNNLATAPNQVTVPGAAGASTAGMSFPMALVRVAEDVPASNVFSSAPVVSGVVGPAGGAGSDADEEPDGATAGLFAGESA